MPLQPKAPVSTQAVRRRKTGVLTRPLLPAPHELWCEVQCSEPSPREAFIKKKKKKKKKNKQAL
eukprot:NODE_4441_length_674_cov_192.009693.p5 GENE.NODE_4441_length_674_cov_192.009693~~NODE_4441_length_674_cov_192.009693.p5  ORF type:complete len:64 (+),score=30.85 NODE_4441_length_674_cov_192.009693:446-637(+)